MTQKLDHVAADGRNFGVFQFKIGHLLLNSLFASLVLGYGGLVVWHWLE